MKLPEESTSIPRSLLTLLLASMRLFVPVARMPADAPGLFPLQRLSRTMQSFQPDSVKVLSRPCSP
jgi:hypothetical protein